VVILLVFNFRIGKETYNLKQTNIAQESQYIIMTWISGTILSEIVVFILYYVTSRGWSYALQYLLFAILMLRNIMTALIMLYYSYYLIQKNMKQSTDD